MELLGGDPVIKPDPDDPRKHWTKGLAKARTSAAHRAKSSASRTTGSGSTSRAAWVVVSDRDHAIFRLADAPLFLSYRLTTGAAKLYHTADDAEYEIGKKDDKRTIYNLKYQDPPIERPGHPVWKTDHRPGDDWRPHASVVRSTTR